jgi:hypothetical protein
MVGIYMHPDVKRQGQLLAEKSGRSFSNLLETLLRAEIARSEARQAAAQVQANALQLEPA